jgi:hypothetical protein
MTITSVVIIESMTLADLMQDDSSLAAVETEGVLP